MVYHNLSFHNDNPKPNYSNFNQISFYQVDSSVSELASPAMISKIQKNPIPKNSFVYSQNLKFFKPSYAIVTIIELML
jgi:hypothetical protein